MTNADKNINSDLGEVVISEEKQAQNSLQDQTKGFHGNLISILSENKLSFSSMVSGDEDRSPYSMTERELRRRAQKRTYGNFSRQLFACMTVTLGSISAGYVMGSVSPKIRQRFKGNLGRFNNDYARFASIVALGFGLGHIFMTFLSVQKGPRKMMLIAAPINFFAWLIIPVMHTDAYETGMMFVCAFLSISYISSGTIWLIDVIHEAFYYHFFAIFMSGYGFGIMLGYIFGLSPDLEYYAEGLGALILCVYFVCLFYCLESPVYLYEKNPMLTEKTLIYYQGRDDIQITMRHIAKDFQARVVSVTVKSMMLSPAVYKAMLIISGVVLVQIIYAYTIFLMYNVSMWASSMRLRRVDIFGEFEDGVLIGFAFFIVPAMAYAVNLRAMFGIRKPILFSAISVPITLGLHALYFHLLDNNYQFITVNSWMRPVIRMLHIICFNIGHASTVQIMIREYLPEQVQMWASIGILSLRWISLSIVLWITFLLEAQFDADVIILCYAVLSCLGIPFCFYFIIESKGKTLQQIQMAIGGNPIGTRSSFRNRYKMHINENIFATTRKQYTTVIDE